MRDKAKILWFEPAIFIFFGLFHTHRIWALVDRNKYADFWLNIMNNRGVLYFLLMGILSCLCIAGIIVFLKNTKNNYWWRWSYIFGGGYVLFDLLAILLKLQFWKKILLFMFDTTSVYWNYIWSFFIIMGILSFFLGLHLIKMMIQSNYTIKRSVKAI